MKPATHPCCLPRLRMRWANLHFYIYFLGVCNVQGMFVVPFEAAARVSDSVVEKKWNNVNWIPEALAWSRRRYSLFCQSMSLFSVVILGLWCSPRSVFPFISSTQSYWRRLTVQNTVVDLSSLCCNSQTSSERRLVQTWPVKRFKFCMVFATW
jgi:hypothetical protein